MQPGFHDFTDEQYHADPCPSPSLSNSLIKVLNNKSPKHAWMSHPRLNKNYQAKDDDKFDLGSAAHAMLLVPDSKICVIDAPDWRTKVAKEQREEAKSNGMLTLLAHQHRKASEMVTIAREFIASSSLLRPVFETGAKEQTITWKEGEIWCRGKLDVYSRQENVVVDYKTTSAANPDAFCRSSIPDFGYDTQDEFYSTGIHVLAGRRPRFVFLVQEDTAPFACYMVEAGPSWQAIAEQKISRAIRTWQKCLESDNWPTYCDSNQIITAEAPAWAIAQEESR